MSLERVEERDALLRKLSENWNLVEELDRVRAVLKARAYLTLLVIALLVGALAAVALLAPPAAIDAREMAVARILVPSLLGGALLLAVYLLAAITGRFNVIGHVLAVNRRIIDTALNSGTREPEILS